MSPGAMADSAADAVLAGQFAIFTHETDAEIYRTWRGDIDASLERAVAGSPPPPVIPPA
jgi:hypothetical protein